MSKPILVTGGAGFIGSHLTDALLRRGATVRVLDDLSSGRLENLEHAQTTGRVELTVGSVCDTPLLQELLAGCSHVFHLAASVGVGTVTAQPLESLENNLDGTRSLFTALRELDGIPPRLIVFSTSEVYGVSEEMPLREDGDLTLGPTSVARWSYAAAKIAGEYHALLAHRQHGIPVSVVRCFNTAGPRQLPTYGMVIPRFFEQALAGDPLTVYGDGSQTRCFSYVGDVVEGVLRLAETPEAAGEVFNIGSDEEVSVLELARRIRSSTRSRSEIRHLPFDDVFGEGFAEARRRVPDLSKIRSICGYRPRADLDFLLGRVLEHYQGRGSAFLAEETGRSLGA